MVVNFDTLKILKVNGTYTFRLLHYDRDINSSRYKITIPCELSELENTLKKFETIESLDIFEEDGITPIYMLKKFTSYVDTTIPKKVTYTTSDGEPVQAITIFLEAVNVTDLIKKHDQQLNPVIDFDAMTLEEYKDHYIKKYNKKCDENIYAGVTVTTEYGEEHFGGKAEDQRNLQVLATAAAATKQPVPYHMDKTRCKLYDWKTIIRVQAEIQKLILREQTYCNALTSYIRTDLTEKSQVSATSYGMKLPDNIAAQMNEAIEQGILVTEMVTAGMLAESTTGDTSNASGSEVNTDTSTEAGGESTTGEEV